MKNLVPAIEFDQMAWENTAPGARFKIFRQNGKQLRLVEFTNEFVEPAWCEKGHVGIVLAGELEVEFKDRVLRYPEGAAIFIQSGQEYGHKARAVTSTVRLFLVEEA
jgi:quercetin dioxygenase-like cupin family protein